MSDGKKNYLDQNLDTEARLDDLISHLTLDEKFELSFGRTMFTARGVKRLGIPPFRMTDGPVGVAFHSSLRRNTLFPATISLAASWNPELCEEFGDVLAKETRATNNSMILAPGINICRTPLNGRTFEYFGEDPYQNSQLAVPIVKGIQKNRVAACVKHFAANNQETHRQSVNVEVSKRALEEIYLPAFKACVEEADAWSVMSCYNRLNGSYGSEHKELLVDRLKDRWGFRGFVVSDWFAASKTKSTAACVEGGLALDMPGKVLPIKMKYRLHPKKMRKAYDRGEFSEASLDRNLRGYLRTMFLTGVFDSKQDLPKGERNTAANREVARKIAEEGTVLLKNENEILPLDINKIETLAVIGPNKNNKTAFVAYGGSSAVWPPYEITALKGIKRKIKGKAKLTNSVADADAVIVVVGFTHWFGGDSEGVDRRHLGLPEEQVELIKDTCRKNKNTIVVLEAGSAVAMDGWIDAVPGILDIWYSGMEGGNVLADILFGDVNPSGKLPITFPKQLIDSPAHASKATFPGIKRTVKYEEGIYVGYRHFDKHNIEPLFPFGFGLSYTRFELSGLTLGNDTISDDDQLAISVRVKNAGNRKGAEVVQLYIQDHDCPIDRPIKELKGFMKIHLSPGESQSVEFLLNKNDLSYFDESVDGWVVQDGRFSILVGNSSRTDFLKQEVFYSTSENKSVAGGG